MDAELNGSGKLYGVLKDALASICSRVIHGEAHKGKNELLIVSHGPASEKGRYVSKGSI